MLDLWGTEPFFGVKRSALKPTVSWIKTARASYVLVI